MSALAAISWTFFVKWNNYVNVNVMLNYAENVFAAFNVFYTIFLELT